MDILRNAPQLNAKLPDQAMPQTGADLTTVTFIHKEVFLSTLLACNC